MAGGGSMKKIKGPLSSFIEDYLNLKRSLGFIYRTSEFCLRDFDLYLLKNFPNTKVVTRKMVIDYLKTTTHLSLITRQGKVSNIRQFLKFLFQYNPDNYIPEKSLLPPAKVKIKPHIYSKLQVLRLMEAARKFPPANSLRPHTYVTIIGLLWVSGLRIGEVVRLNIGDVDLEKNLLYIQKTKFFKSRIVPISKSSASSLGAYKKKRDYFGYSSSSNSPFFIHRKKKRYSKSTIQHTFHDLVKKLGLKTLQGGYPRLLDFRHTFATTWLADLYEKGKDPNAYLPILATYLGHANIANTQVYLHMSRELLHKAGEMFYQYVKGVLDEKTK